MKYSAMGKIIWFIIFLWAACSIALFLVVTARGETVQFQWDYPTDESIDGFRLYQRLEGSEYGAPVLETDPSMRDVTLEVTGEENTFSKYQFMLRAFRGNNESVDSNEVEFSVDKRIVPPATNFTIIVVGVPTK